MEVSQLCSMSLLNVYMLHMYIYVNESDNLPIENQLPEKQSHTQRYSAQPHHHASKCYSYNTNTIT